jgi:hypothetical protein
LKVFFVYYCVCLIKVGLSNVYWITNPKLMSRDCKSRLAGVEPSLQILSFVIILIVEAILIFRGFNWISILIPLLIVVAVNFYSSHKSVASNIRQDEITRMEGMGLKDVNVSVEYIGNEEYRCKISGYDPGVNTTYGSSQPKLMNATIIYRWNSNEKSYVRVRNE